MGALSDEQKFYFDLWGFVVLRGVLTRAECDRLSSLSDEIWPRQPDDGPFRRISKVSQWGQSFLDLIDHPKVLPTLVELIGSRLRIDHDYCIYMQKHETNAHLEALRSGVGHLHGGPRRIETDHWYHYADGVMRNGLTVATWALSDAAPGDGGFACIPGSHKTNFMMNVPDDVRSFERPVDYVMQPELRAGDVLIFTEALIHGTAPWTADHERRTLLFKYSPPHSTWAKVPYDVADYPDATPQQRRLMAPPSVEAHEPVIQPSER